MDTKPLKLSYEVNLEPGEPLVLPPSLVNVGPGHWVVTVEPVDDGSPVTGQASERDLSSAAFAVVKRDGSQEPFDRNAIASDIVRACAGIAVQPEAISSLVENIEERLLRRNARHVKAEDISDMILGGLQELSDAAYIRYALGQREL
ncbi:MAG: ATP cone domain-containing protein [Cyanobacteria bacterium J06642_2]